MIAAMRSWLALVLVAAACHVSADFQGTSYQCPDGKCPSGYACVAGVCVLPGAKDGSIGDVADGPPDAAPVMSWWDPAFTKRARLTITNGAADPLVVGFQIGVPVDLATLDSPTAVWDALRVVRWDATAMTWTEKTRYIEQNAGGYHIWFKLDTQVDPAGSDSDYYLYFGNPAPAAAPSSGSAVFDFYDAFSGTAVSTTSWTIQGSPTVANNDLTLVAGASILSKTAFTPGHALTASMTGPADAPRFWLGYQTDLMDNAPWIIWINRDLTDSYTPPGAVAGTIWPETYSTAAGMSGPAYGTAKTLDGAKHYYTVQRLADRVVYKYEEQPVTDFALPQTDSTSLPVRLTNEGTKSLVFGMVHVRKAVWPDPTVAIGATETH